MRDSIQAAPGEGGLYSSITTQIKKAAGVTGSLL